MMQRHDTGSKREYQYARISADYVNAELGRLSDEGWEVHTIDFPAGGAVVNVLLTRLVVEERQYLSDAVRAGVM